MSAQDNIQRQMESLQLPETTKIALNLAGTWDNYLTNARAAFERGRPCDMGDYVSLKNIRQASTSAYIRLHLSHLQDFLKDKVSQLQVLTTRQLQSPYLTSLDVLSSAHTVFYKSLLLKALDKRYLAPNPWLKDVVSREGSLITIKMKISPCKIPVISRYLRRYGQHSLREIVYFDGSSATPQLAVFADTPLKMVKLCVYAASMLKACRTLTRCSDVLHLQPTFRNFIDTPETESTGASSGSIYF